MSETATLRATSLLASAGILGGLVIVALTFTYVLPEIDPILDGPVITAEREPAPLPPPPPEPIHQPLRVPTPDAEPLPAIFPSFPSDTTALETDVPYTEPYVAPVITQPHWLRRPRDLQRYYPRQAMARGVEGDVQLDCIVGVTGALRCSVISETPPSWGFADAARRIASEHRMEPAMRDGAAVEGRYRMRVPFRLE